MMRLLKFLKKNDEILIVSGLPRSGTSLMMQIVTAGGIEPLNDGRRIADIDNPKGYHEFEKVKDLPYGDHGWLEKARGRVVKIVSTLLIYLPNTFRYKLIFVERDLDEIIQSQEKMITRLGTQQGGQSIGFNREMLAEHLRDIKNWLSNSENARCIYVSYNELLKFPDNQIEALVEYLGLSPENKHEMIGAVDRTLYRNRTSPIPADDV